MCSVYKTKNNNNWSAITSQFEEDNFFIFEKMFSPFLNDAKDGVACLFLNVLLVLRISFTYLMEAEICLARYASNPISF